MTSSDIGRERDSILRSPGSMNACCDGVGMLRRVTPARKTVVAVLLAALTFSRLALSQANIPSADTWSLFRGDPQSTGVATTTLPTDLQLLWKYEVENGAFESTAVIEDGVAYIGDLDGLLLALDLNTGKVIWRHQSKSDIGFAASPGVKDGRVYVGDMDGLFCCVDAKRGELLWEFATDAEINSSPNFYKDQVLFGSQDATLYALNVETGHLVWKYQIEDQIRCTPSIIGDRAFVAGCDAKLHIIDLVAQKSAGFVAIDGPTGVTPAVSDDFAFFGTESGTLYSIDWKNKSVEWTFVPEGRSASMRSSAAVTKDLVIVGSRTKRVIAVDKQTGKQRWEFVTKRGIDSSPLVADDRIVVGSDEGRVYALNLAGEKVWEFEGSGSFSASPSAANGKLVIASTDGVVYCFGEK